MDHITKQKIPRGLLLLVVLFWGLANTYASSNKRVMVIALDASKSMTGHDPHRERIEAAKMLVSAADPDDEVGVLVFGEHARWLTTNQTTRAADFNLQDLDGVGEGDHYTDFADLLDVWSTFIVREPAGYFDTHDVSLIILTDGEPRSKGEKPEENARRALTLARDSSTHSKLFTIGLGPEARSSTLLYQLADTSHGSTAYANTESELTDAFLQIGTKALHLPAYQRLDTPGVLKDFGQSTRALLIFLGRGDFVVPGGKTLLGAGSVKVVDAANVRPGTAITWQGPGTAFYCLRQPLLFDLVAPLPPAVVTNASVGVDLKLTNRQRPIEGAYFLNGADLQLICRAAQGTTIQKTSLGKSGRVSYVGLFTLSEPGAYDVGVRLSAHYGELDQNLTHVTASESAISIQPQVTASVFDPLPRSWFSQTLAMSFILPSGVARVGISSPPQVVISPERLVLAPGKQSKLTLKVASSFETGTIQVLSYQTQWDDGTGTITRNGNLRVYLEQMTLLQFLWVKWPWVAVLIFIVILVFWGFLRYWPRPLRGRLQLLDNGVLIASMDLPKDRRLRFLKIAETGSDFSSQSPSVLMVKGATNAEILILSSERNMGRWTTILMPGPLGIETANGIIFHRTDLRTLSRRTVFSADRRIEIRFN